MQHDRKGEGQNDGLPFFLYRKKEPCYTDSRRIKQNEKQNDGKNGEESL